MSEPKINLGIDLGTTYSCVAFCKDNKPEIIRSDSGENIVPSVVRIEGPKNFVVGTLAKNHAAKNPENTINNIKRLMGMLANDESIKGDLDAFSFKTETRNGELKVVIQMPEGNYEDYYPEEISAMILHHLLQMAKNQFGDKIGKTVITVPAYFNESQRQATKDAAKIAGLEVEQILDEPTAAAFYHLGRQTITTDEEFNLLVFDLGGGTFDVTVLTRFNDVCDVKPINGDNHLGGEDFTDELLNYVVNNYPSSPVELDKGKSLKLKAFCETAKKELSELDETHLDLSGVFPDGPDDYLITRSIFEEINKENFQRLWDCVLKGLKEAELEPKDIKEIVLVGGSTRIPKIQNMLKDAFSHIKKLTTDLNPDESVALGAALKATKLAAKDKKDASKICTLWDVTSHSLGIETSGGHFSKIIPKNMTVPAAEEKKYVTTDDNQESARFSVFEGENVIARKNRFLGMFILDGIPPLPKGEVSFTVKLKKDVNKILVVSAVCDANKKEKELKISLEGKKLTEEEIRRLRGKLGFELQEE